MTPNLSGDGHTGALPVLGTDGPTIPRRAAPRRAVTIVVHASPAQQMIDELRLQTSLQLRANELLHRSLLGDVDQLDAADVMVALKLGRTKLGELVEDGEIPMYRLPVEQGKDEAKAPRRIGRETLRAVIRRWAEGRR